MRMLSLVASVLALSTSATAINASEVTGEDFYAGKTIEILVGFGAGGGYDTYARAIGQFIGNHIPGNPDVIVRNTPGAGSLTLVNRLYSVEASDGTVFGTFDQSVPIAPLVDPENNTFDAREMSWVGSAATGTALCVTWHDSGINSWEDLLESEEPVVFGATGPDDVRYTHAAILKNVFGANIEIVPGYEGSAEVRAAMERGEIDGNCGESWSSLKSTAAGLLEDEMINLLIQFAPEKHDELQDVPLVVEEVEDPDQLAALRLLLAPLAAGRPYAAPPGVPEERLEILREAFEATISDPEFLAFAEQAQLEIGYTSGREIEELLAEVYETPESAITTAREITE